MTRLHEYARAQAAGRMPTLADVEGTEVRVDSFELFESELGQYVVLQAVTPDGEKRSYRCMGMFVIDALVTAEAEGAFPLQATFTRKGRAWIVE